MGIGIREQGIGGFWGEENEPIYEYYLFLYYAKLLVV